MKAFIAALSLTIASTGALAEFGKPFEQLDIDRALPNVSERQTSTPAGESTRLAALSGETRSDAEIAVATESSSEENGDTSPFANDWSVIAPAQ